MLYEKEENGGRQICVATGKVCYTYNEAAHIVHFSHKKKRGRNHLGKDIPRRFYKCDKCGCMHITSLKTQRRVVHGTSCVKGYKVSSKENV